MRRKSRLWRFAISLYVCLLVAAGWMVHAQQIQSSNFQGTVTAVEQNPQARLAHYHFEPGARTKWHSHENGQILLFEEGVGRTQLQGGSVKDMRPGDTTWSPAGVPHWHGAAPDKGATIFAVSRGMTTWMGEVSEKEYTARPR